MNSTITILLWICVISTVLLSCQTNVNPKLSTQNETSSALSKYDSVAAVKYGADEYGMRKYVIAFLKRGPNRDRSQKEAEELQAAHMSNINRLAEDGKLAVAGPFIGDSDLRGIYIFNVETIQEAKDLTNSDPAIQAGSLIMELHEWYGSAAVSAIAEIHETLQKTSF